VFNVLSKIAVVEEIVDAQPDINSNRFLYVQTKKQIYLYDCESMHNQYVAPDHKKQCVFVKKLLKRGQPNILSFKALKNVLLIYYEDSYEIMYTHELIKYLKKPSKGGYPKNSLVVIEKISCDNRNLGKISLANTGMNSLLMHAKIVKEKGKKVNRLLL